MHNSNLLKILFIFLMMTVGLFAFQNGEEQDLPKPVILGSLANIFHPVSFSHDTHAHMSEMGTGCETCHHDFEDGDYEPCSACHTNTPASAADETPSLNGAYHRKCMNCHREYKPKQSICSTCHVVKDDDLLTALAKNKIRSPRLDGPETLRFDTPDAEQAMVTFHHKEHVQLFRIDCAACHQDESCSKCHSYNDDPMNEVAVLETMHVPCESCHDVDDDDECQYCHQASPSPGFSHNLTGWPLKDYHADNSCATCHVGTEKIQALDRTCTNCHDNFTLGEFDHAATGLELFEEHQEFDCSECHENERFDKTPVCTECHDDDYSFPDDLPGEYLE